MYDGFANLWRFPYLAFSRPFSLSADEDIWVPWQHAYRHWGRHDLFFSEWGLPSTLLFFVAPHRRRTVCADARRTLPGHASAGERAFASLSFVLVFLLFLPLRMQTIGVLATSGLWRSTFFVPAVISLWTAVPAVAELRARRRGGDRTRRVGRVFGAPSRSSSGTRC